MSRLAVLRTYLRWNALLLLWADLPWQPIEDLPLARAAVIGRMRGEARGLPAPIWPLHDLPPAPILSLDPTDRLARAFAAAGAPLHHARTRADVPAAGRHNLLHLGGDLESRRGLLLTWEDAARLRTDEDKRHLLAESARHAHHGGVLVLRPTPDPAFAPLWQQIAPTLGETGVYGLGPGDWPAGIEPLAEGEEEVLAALARVERRGPLAFRHSARVEALRRERAQRFRRLLRVREELARRPGDVALQLAAEEEAAAVAAIERQLDELLEGDAGR